MTAVISACNRYRYRLDRVIGPTGPVYAFIGVNPSTADATEDDATVRKWRGFVRLWGGSRFIVGNIFALRATNVRDLVSAEDPVGPENHRHVWRMCMEADIVVPCWGNREKLPPLSRWLVDKMNNTLMRTEKPLRTFGFTKGGDPMHPLMLPYSTPLVRYVRPI